MVNISNDSLELFGKTIGTLVKPALNQASRDYHKSRLAIKKRGGTQAELNFCHVKHLLRKAELLSAHAEALQTTSLDWSKFESAQKTLIQRIIHANTVSDEVGKSTFCREDEDALTNYSDKTATRELKQMKQDIANLMKEDLDSLLAAKCSEGAGASGDNARGPNGTVITEIMKEDLDSLPEMEGMEETGGTVDESKGPDEAGGVCDFIARPSASLVLLRNAQRSLINSPSPSPEIEDVGKCKFCNKDLPEGFDEEPPTAMRARLVYCKRHDDAAVLNWGIKKGYPRSINVTDLDTRIKKLKGEVHRLLSGGNESQFLAQLKMRVEGRLAAQPMIRIRFFEGCLPGYYGPMGAEIIADRMMRDFGKYVSSEKSLVDGVRFCGGPMGFVSSVLVPEVAVRLIMEDMNVNWEEACQIMRDSVIYGDVVNPKVEDSDEDGNSEDGNSVDDNEDEDFD